MIAGVFIGWRNPAGDMVHAGWGNLTHTVDEAVRRRAVLLNGCSVYAIHFTPQEMRDRKIFPLSSGTSWIPKNEPAAGNSQDAGVNPKAMQASDGWGDLAERGTDGNSVEAARRGTEESKRNAEELAAGVAGSEQEDRSPPADVVEKRDEM